MEKRKREREREREQKTKDSDGTEIERFRRWMLLQKNVFAFLDIRDYKCFNRLFYLFRF